MGTFFFTHSQDTFWDSFLDELLSTRIPGHDPDINVINAIFTITTQLIFTPYVWLNTKVIYFGREEVLVVNNIKTCFATSLLCLVKFNSTSKADHNSWSGTYFI